MIYIPQTILIAVRGFLLESLRAKVILSLTEMLLSSAELNCKTTRLRPQEPVSAVCMLEEGA